MMLVPSLEVPVVRLIDSIIIFAVHVSRKQIIYLHGQIEEIFSPVAVDCGEFCSCKEMWKEVICPWKEINLSVLKARKMRMRADPRRQALLY
jgi:hypothetical protein